MGKEIAMYPYSLKVTKKMKHRCKDMESLRNIMPFPKGNEPDTKEYILCVQFIWNSLKDNSIVCDKKNQKVVTWGWRWNRY